jgi:coenzyme F420-0:L-glutamate ligase/coenzyme F420-1:gamma-L-glutamate ligase
MTVEVVPVRGLPEVRAGDDLVALLSGPLRALGTADGDVVAVTQKIVSKAEGRGGGAGGPAGGGGPHPRVGGARPRPPTPAAPRHGFVCANAGVDASNVDPGTLALLPHDPDGSADRLRLGLVAELGLDRLGVVITDTFGRPWREGVVNVAIGVAGLPAVEDLRGTPDDRGRVLETTVVALADEVAAASGLVMAKAGRAPAALVRGVRPQDPHATPGRGADLVRSPADDLFRESPLQALHARRTIRSFGPGRVPREAIEEAVLAACAAPAPHHTRPWRFTVLESDVARRALLATIAHAWRTDLRGDGTPEDVIERRIARSDEVLGAAPVLIVPWVRFRGAHPYPDAERARAEREMFLLSGGAAIQNLLLALHARGLASCWISSTLFCQDETRAVLDADDDWYALGTVACGPMPEAGATRPRPPLDLAELIDIRSS